jgi:hypothetical protein
MNFLNTTRSSYVLDASIAIIFFGENEYCSGRRIGPTLNSIKKTNTKGNLKFYLCFKNDIVLHPMVSCWLLRWVFNFVGNILGSIETSKYLCEVTWKRVTLQMLPMVTLSRKWHNIKHPSDIFNLAIWLVKCHSLCFSKCHIEWVGANWS